MSKLIWHRTDDIRHGRVHPAKYHKVKVYHALGNVLAYQHVNAAVQTSLEHGFGEALSVAATNTPVADQGVGPTMFDVMLTCPYNFGVVTQELREVQVPMDTRWSLSRQAYWLPR
jgi:isoquinoline 1-oxidoreductase beta subunit